MAEDLEIMEEIIDKVNDFKKKESARIDEIVAEQIKQGATVGQIMEEIKGMQAKAGHAYGNTLTKQGQTTVDVLNKAFEENAQQIKALHDSGEGEARLSFRTKTVGNMTASANLTGSVQATYSTIPAVRGRQRLHIRDIVDVIPSTTGFWKFYRQNIPTGEGSFDFQTTHGNTKNQLDYDMTEVTVTVDYLAGFARFAKQMSQDLGWLQGFLSAELVEDYMRTESFKFFGAIYSAATGSTAGITSTVTAEKIIDVIANLSEDDYDPNGIVVTNLVWAKLLKTKPQDYSLPGGNAFSVDLYGNLLICGIPVLRTKASNIGNNMMLIGDWTKAKIIQTDGLSVKFSEEDGDNFVKNMITAKCEARVNIAILRPSAFTYISAGTT